MSNEMNEIQFVEQDNEQAEVDQNNWTILIVDDDDEVHQVTKLALRNFRFLNKGVDFLSAYTVQEAKTLLQESEYNIAVVLLDIVMKGQDSGLKLVEYIRNELNNNLVRIILRTGQPGQIPAKEIIVKYEINDYKLKTELTAEKLFGSLVTALRTYDDLLSLELSKRELAKTYEELKSAEQTLAQKEAYLRQIIDINPHFIFAKDREGRFTLANEAFAKAYGTTVDNLIGKTDSDFNPHTSLVERYNRDDFSVIETGQDLFIEEEQVTNIAGQSLWRKTVKRPVLDKNGKPYQVLGIATDITELKRAELALRDSEERLRTFVEALPDITFIKDENGLYVEVLASNDNPLYEGAVELLKGKYLHDVLPQDKAELFLKIIHTTLETGKPQTLEYEIDTPMGPAWFEGRTSPIKSYRDEPRRIVWLARDISIHKQMEERIRQYQLTQQQAAIIDSAKVLIGTAYPDGRTNYLNKSGLELLGYSSLTEVDNKPILEFVDPNEVPRFEQEVLPTLFAKGSWRGETSFVTKDGKTIPVDQTLFLVKDENDQVQLIATSVTDITERQRAVGALQESESRYRQILDAITQMVLVKGEKSRIVWANKAFRDYYGMTNDELQALIDAPFNEPDYTQQYIKDDAYVFDNGEVLDITEEPVTRYDGVVKLFHTVKSPIFDADGKVTMTVGVSEDITHRKQAEAELEARLQELNALQRVMSREAWHSYLAVQDDAISGYLFEHDTVKPVLRASDLITLDLSESKSADKTSHVVTKPISLGGEVIGELGVYEDSSNSTLSSEDQEFLNLVTEQVAEAMERARLLEQTQKRAIELETVAQVGTIASTTLEVDKLLQTVVDLTKSSFDLYHAHIYLLNDSQDTLVLTAGADEVGRQLVSQGWSIPYDKEHSLVALAARIQDGVMANNVHLEPDFLANPLLPNTQSELAVPLIVGEQVLGVLDVQGDKINRFTEIDVRIQSTLATQIAVALENARLFEQQQAVTVEIEEQVSRLGVLNELSVELTAVRTLDDIYKVAAARAKEIIDCDRVSIARLTDSGNEFEIVDFEENISVSRKTWSLEETGIGQVFKFNQLVNYSDFRKLDWADTNQLLKQGFYSALVMPLLVGGKVIGTFNMASKNVDAFSASAESLMRQLGSTFSSIIESRRLFEQTQTALAETETLYDLIGMLSAANNLEEILSVIGISKHGVTSADFFIIETDSAGEPEWLELSASWSFNNPPLAQAGLRVSVSEFVASDVWLKNPDEPFFIDDCRNDSRLNQSVKSVLEQLNIRATLIMPLRMGNKWVGLITSNWPEAQHFTDKDKRLYQSIAAQTAVVSNNLLLLEQTRLNLVETERRFQAASRISETQDLQQLISVVINEGPVQTFNRALLFEYERSNDQNEVQALVVVANWFSGQGVLPSPIGRRYPLADFPSFQLTLSSDPIFMSNAQMDKRTDSGIAVVAQQQDIKALVVLPLRAGGRPQGTLFLEAEVAYEFTQRDIREYIALSPQIAAAVENHRLLEETRQALSEVEAIQRRYTVQSWETYQNKQQIYGYQKIEDEVAPITRNELPVSLEKIDGGAKIVEGAPSRDLNTNEQFMQKKPSANLIVPLTIRNEIIGLLGLEETGEEIAWSAEEVALVEAVAEQIAQVAENIRLLDETQSRAAREQRVNEIGDKIQAAQSLEEALRIAAKEVGLSLKAPQTTAQLKIE
ncbi:MAG: PAS domain S-box protein [Anaerolineae bacterium]|nr:PAS domain S-box protein [Anaerolineae bacterium]